MFDPNDILDYWFPDDGHWETLEAHLAFWHHRMQGGADHDILSRFGPVTLAAAQCELDHWANEPKGRLALLIALDQFSRSYWRDTPQSYGQDIKACRLAMEALENGHYDALSHPWERQFHIIAITHCEGPDHLARMDLALDLTKKNIASVPAQLAPMIDRAMEQVHRVRENIRVFGRHPHRNNILGRVSSQAEAAYIDKGEFPHQNRIEATTDP